MDYVIIKSLHLIAIFLVVASVFAEFILVKPVLKIEVIRYISLIDAVYGISSILVVGLGLYLWFGVGKGENFYGAFNWIYIKVAVFSLVGILSLVPTIFFFKNRKGDPDQLIELPKYIKPIIIAELILLFLMPFLATAMSSGISF
jgi:putative membrane protein